MIVGRRIGVVPVIARIPGGGHGEQVGGGHAGRGCWEPPVDERIESTCSCAASSLAESRPANGLRSAAGLTSDVAMVIPVGAVRVNGRRLGERLASFTARPGHGEENVGRPILGQRRCQRKDPGKAAAGERGQPLIFA